MEEGTGGVYEGRIMRVAYPGLILDLTNFLVPILNPIKPDDISLK
jgi:hypothetical protein